ncbi:MAG: signal peptidase I [Coriobacteriia bacterium]|nr:signal peptidase I [Coriobacteriia bacterium]
MPYGEHSNAEERPKVIRFLINLVLVVVVVLVLQFLLREFVFQAYNVPSGSMETTIQTDDMIFSEKVSYYFSAPKQGDIITFEDPETPGRTLVKRIIAVGGQSVNLQDGRVVIDGVPLDESYTNGKPSNPLPGTTITYPYVVPEGYVWVMGDNRTNSSDSRAFGAIKVSSITGKACVCYWPIDHIGLLN